MNKLFANHEWLTYRHWLTRTVSFVTVLIAIAANSSRANGEILKPDLWLDTEVTDNFQNAETDHNYQGNKDGVTGHHQIGNRFNEISNARANLIERIKAKKGKKIKIINNKVSHQTSTNKYQERFAQNLPREANSRNQKLFKDKFPKISLQQRIKSRQAELIQQLKRDRIQVVDSFDVSHNISHDIFQHTNTTKQKSAQSDLVERLKTHRQTISQSMTIAQSGDSGAGRETIADTNQLRQELLIDPIEPVLVRETIPVAAPSSSAGTPTAYGIGSRQAYIGGGVSFPIDGERDRTDGSLSFGFGEGDPVRTLGVEFNFNITSVGSGDNFDFGDSGTIGFKLHRLLGRGTAVAFGWSNPIRWGDSDRSRPTLYGVFSKSIPLIPNGRNRKLPLTVSVGVGSGGFRSKGALEAVEDTPNVFGSIGLQVIPQASLVGSWTGNRLNLGVSVVPLKNLPLVINAIYTDVTDNLGFGSGLSIVAGSGFRF